MNLKFHQSSITDNKCVSTIIECMHMPVYRSSYDCILTQVHISLFSAPTEYSSNCTFACFQMLNTPVTWFANLSVTSINECRYFNTQGHLSMQSVSKQHKHRLVEDALYYLPNKLMKRVELVRIKMESLLLHLMSGGKWFSITLLIW